MQDVVRILTPVAIFFAGTLYLAFMRDIMEEPSETHITAEEARELWIRQVQR